MQKDQMTPIIQASELLQLYNSANLIIIDVNNGKNAKDDYQKKHLDGALYVDLNTQLSGITDNPSQGGRHPLPSVEQFSELLSDLGISKASHIVLYDNHQGANAAARFWWMLKSAGHNKVQVLNGGLLHAEKIGIPTNSNTVTSVKAEPYKYEKWQLPTADLNEVEQVTIDNNKIVIDVRDNDRYSGIREPIDLIAGHIPGAINIPFSSNLNDNGLFLSPKELKNKYQKVFAQASSEDIIVHCGSGVTACHTLLAMDYAGFQIPKLYVGSWSEWSRNDKPIVTQDK